MSKSSASLYLIVCRGCWLSSVEFLVGNDKREWVSQGFGGLYHHTSNPLKFPPPPPPLFWCLVGGTTREPFCTLLDKIKPFFFREYGCRNESAHVIDRVCERPLWSRWYLIELFYTAFIYQIFWWHFRIYELSDSESILRPNLLLDSTL